MKYLLDTEICIQLLNGKSSKLEARLLSKLPEDILISAISAAELWLGASKGPEAERNGLLLRAFLAPFGTQPFDGRSAERCVAVRDELERAGKKIGPLDTLIAAHALALEAILVTKNEREFRGVRDLRVENWLR